jgi:3-deoxy-D-manno-octulosonate 8-phosphate phosphatase (KDO 8-P phosphatase)
MNSTFHLKYITNKELFLSKLNDIKAFVFDWDGVFTSGEKDFELQSRFNEIDSMGTNLLRFSYYLKNKHLPLAAIISGEKNKAAFTFTNRECFHCNYFKIANKIDAAKHICLTHNLALKNIAFVFDDVLDLSIAKECGLRIFITRKSTRYFSEYVIKNNLADLIIDGDSVSNPVRLICEEIINNYGLFDEVIHQRVQFSDNYKGYLEFRKTINPVYYNAVEGKITETTV